MLLLPLYKRLSRCPWSVFRQSPAEDGVEVEDVHEEAVEGTVEEGVWLALSHLLGRLQSGHLHWVLRRERETQMCL
jgi:hypothetical protein